jgi:hypothetical protein
MQTFNTEKPWWLGVAAFMLIGSVWVALAAPDDVAIGWRLVAIGAGGLIAALIGRAALRSGVRIERDEVFIVGPIRTVRIPRARVDHFELQAVPPFIAEAVEVDGTTHPIWGIAVPRKDLSDRRRYEAMVERMNAALSP